MKSNPPLGFLSGGGEMGERMRAFDWRASPLGPPETWPVELQVSVGLMLNHGFPILIMWGPDLIELYNDPYSRLLGPEQHPRMLGAPAREIWEEIWEEIGGQIDSVMRGEGATFDQNRKISFERDGERKDMWWTYSYAPIERDGSVGGVFVISSEVTDVHRARIALHDQADALERLFENAPSFIAVLEGRDHVFRVTNAAYRKLIGDRNVIGLPVRTAVPEAEGQGFFELLDDVYLRGVSHVRLRRPLALDDNFQGKREVFLDFVYQPIRNADGQTTGVFVEGSDVTKHVETEELVRLANMELKHRGKNMLTMVSVIAARTFGADDRLPLFQNRIRAFDKAHDLLTNREEISADIHDVLQTALGPHLGPEARISFSGPPVSLDFRQTVSLSLAAYELATNATKYGALSNETGRVAVTWRWIGGAEGAAFEFAWRETGGPPVVPPQRKGFGNTILTRVLGLDFDGTVDLRFDPDGLSLILSVPDFASASPDGGPNYGVAR